MTRPLSAPRSTAMYFFTSAIVNSLRGEGILPLFPTAGRPPRSLPNGMPAGRKAGTASPHFGPKEMIIYPRRLAIANRKSPSTRSASGLRAQVSRAKSRDLPDHQPARARSVRHFCRIPSPSTSLRACPERS